MWSSKLFFLAAFVIFAASVMASELEEDEIIRRYMGMFEMEVSASSKTSEIDAKLKASLDKIFEKSKLKYKAHTKPYLSNIEGNKAIFSFEVVTVCTDRKPLSIAGFRKEVDAAGTDLDIKILTPRLYKTRVQVLENGNPIDYVTDLEHRNRLKWELEQMLNAKFDANLAAPGDLKFTIVDKSWSWCQYYDESGKHTVEIMTIIYSPQILTKANARALATLENTLSKVIRDFKILSWNFIEESRDPDLYCRGWFKATIELESTKDAHLQPYIAADAVHKSVKFDSNAFIVEPKSIKMNGKTATAYFKNVCKIDHDWTSDLQSYVDERSPVFFVWPHQIKSIKLENAPSGTLFAGK